MGVVFTNRKCKVCKIKLTEFEVSDKQQMCIDCYKENHEEAKGK
jgi:hypothetical protein